MLQVSPRIILKSLSPARLVELARILDVTLDGEDTASHVDALLEAPDMHLPMLASLLRRDELKQVCEANGIHIRGRMRGELVDKLVEAAGPAAMVADRARYTGRIAVPKQGDVIQVRRRQYFVEDVRASREGESDRDTLLSLVGLDDDNQGRRLEVIWELELGTRVLASAGGGISQVKQIDAPEIFSAYLNALRWSTVSATDPNLFQAPHRAGIAVMPHQMTALKKALELPRANLFIADDVGLGKTIEAGLVLQELMLRQRVDFVLIVCPASVCLQWRDEMASRFGIQCEIYNRAFVSRRRQERGFGVNPWGTHSRFIISHQTLRQPEYREALKGVFDGKRNLSKSLLILDEAHVAAPASESSYAVDSNTTKMIREIAPLFKNRLFLSATPHNGHSNSFSALLEILDPQRFLRGVPVRGREQLKPIMVRRLKSDLRNIQIDGKYPDRKVIEVKLKNANGRWLKTQNKTQTDIGPGDGSELELARLLAAYTEQAAPKRGKGKLVFINLQKRLLSSVEAFARTFAVHLKNSRAKVQKDSLHVETDGYEDTQAMSDADDEYGPSEETLAAVEEEANALSSAQVAPPNSSSVDLCKQMQRLADAQRHVPDAKTLALLAFIREHMCPAVGLSKPTSAQRQWLPRRLIIFTEYSDTKRYLIQQLDAALAGTDRADERICEIYGGMNDELRAEVQRNFCADYDKSPVRILVATDAAREGLNLQRRCSELFHFDIPWNPGRMEQRNGRIDRVNQPEKEVRCHYFSYEQRAEDRVLEVLARKVETISEELGSLSEVVLERMSRAVSNGISGSSLDDLRKASDAGEAGKIAKSELDGGAREDEIRAEIDTARDLYTRAGEILKLRPEALRATLDTALQMMDVDPLQPIKEGPDGVERFTLPELPSAWQDTLDSLRVPRQRGEDYWDWKRSPPQPVCFDPGADSANGAVPLHLSHPLVKRLLARFTSQGFGDHKLSRVTALRNKGDGHIRVIALGRLSLFGASAARLHDHLVWVSAARRELKRGEVTFKPFHESLDKEALAHFWELMDGKFKGVSKAEKDKIVTWAPTDFASLWPALEADARTKEAEALNALKERGQIEAEAMRALLRSQMDFLDSKLKERSVDRRSFEEAERGQRQQYELDTKAMTERQKSLELDLETEPRDIERQYHVQLRRFEPIGLIYLCPEGV